MAPKTETANLPLLAPSEWRIFLVLSFRSPLTIKEIGIELSRRDPDFRQGHATLSTLLKRIIAKGYVRQKANEDVTMPTLYWPTAPLDLALRRHVERFLFDFTQQRREALEIVLDVVKQQAVDPDASPGRGSLST
jgi:predicted transcriptional regulator